MSWKAKFATVIVIIILIIIIIIIIIIIAIIIIIIIIVTIYRWCRNRQMEAFYDVVLWFQPGFVLMENVVDTLKKEDGMSAKSAMGSLLLLNYQVRMGIIAACDQGVPQVRNRYSL